jgi:wyosine [tRNA(Phe)-imidazoG37] synthetase (radical SAM superfamily)
MALFDSSKAFGPVPSRRLGMSMGINNIPAKVCTYACIYCQLGRTTMMTKNRSEFYDPQKIYRAVQKKVAKALESGVQTDYLTFVPDGEPTLDINLGKAIDLLKLLGIPIGVISNSSLMWRTDVREELARADWVSLKVDAFEDRTWRRINRPEVYLQHFSIQGGMAEFTKYFSGRLVTETMLIKNLNDNDDQLRDMADYIAELEPHTAYISIPVRPPLEKWVHRPDEDRLNKAFQIFSDKLPRVECLIGYEGNAFAFTGDAEKDLLSITAVHPMRKSAVEKLLSKAGEPWDLVENLIAAGDLKESLYEGHAYYLRTFGP